MLGTKRDRDRQEQKLGTLTGLGRDESSALHLAYGGRWTHVC